MARWSRLGVLIAALVLFNSTAAHAQASVAGAVKDASGAVLPGVTVEAASPALIEKARSVVTDDTGQYKIVDLRPGAYAITFTLTGFSTVKREGIELTGSGTTTVNADLKVGTLAETITVTRNEILTGLNKPDAFVLAIVLVEDAGALEPRYVHKPFKKDPDWDAVSVNYDLSSLLKASEAPS